MPDDDAAYPEIPRTATLAKLLGVILLAEAAIMLALPSVAPAEAPRWVHALVDIVLLGLVGAAAGRLLLRARTAALATRAQAASILESVQDVILTTDAAGRIRYANGAASRALGYAPRDLLGSRLEALLLPPARSASARLGVRRDGSTFPVEVTTHVPTTPAAAPFATVVIRDVTGRTAADKELRRLLLALQSTSEAVMITDAEGRIVRVNPAFVAQTGYAEAEALGATPRLLKSGLVAPEVHADLWRSIRAGRPWRGRLVNRRKDGGLYDAAETVAPILEDGQVVGYIACLRDVTDDLQREERLTRALDEARAATEAKALFVANASHELRTPLHGVLGLLHLLQETELSPEQRELVGTAASCGTALLALVGDVLDFSKLEADRLELDCTELDPRAAVEEAVESLAAAAHAKGLDLVCDADALPRRAHGDPARLRQVITNLVANAVKFTTHGEVVVRCRRDDGRLRCEVRDTGIGVDPAVQPTLFQPFVQADGSTTRRFGGTGLGLAISKRLVERMGGEIGFESEPGRGSSFWFEVPLPVPERVDPDPELEPRLDGRRVLVVEGNAVAREALVEGLRRCGAVAEGAAGVDAAEALLRVASFDALVVDGDLPRGAGLDAVRVLGRVGLPCVATLPVPMLARAAEVRAAGAVGQVTKPAHVGRVARTLLSLPGREGRATARPARGPDALPAGRRVLVADDNPVNLLLARRMLERLGLTVDEARTGRESVRAAASASYDLILMDWHMPDMDGLEATRRIRAQEGERRTPIVAVTASVSPAERQRCLVAGMDDHLSKPFHPDDLARVVDRWSDQPTKRSQDAARPASSRFETAPGGHRRARARGPRTGG